jgi:hypothetical protein
MAVGTEWNQLQSFTLSETKNFMCQTNPKECHSHKFASSKWKLHLKLEKKILLLQSYGDQQAVSKK